jgi:hypothetical protein
MKNSKMDELDQLWEMGLHTLASHFEYPRTPDLAERISSRSGQGLTPVSGWITSRTSTRQRRMRLGMAFIILLLALIGLMSVPPVRAAVLEFLQIGVVRIFPATATPSLTPTTQFTPTVESSSTTDSTVITATATTPQVIKTPPASLTPTPETFASIIDLSGETTLEDAQVKLSFQVKLPAYPEALGLPDRIYYQNHIGEFVILVWLDPDHIDHAWLALYEIGPEAYIEKIAPQVVQETQVDGHPAFWTTGPYILRMKNGFTELNRLVQGHVLIWADGEVTYRLETSLSLDEALLIAASLE